MVGEEGREMGTEPRLQKLLKGGPAPSPGSASARQEVTFHPPTPRFPWSPVCAQLRIFRGNSTEARMKTASSRT